MRGEKRPYISSDESSIEGDTDDEEDENIVDVDDEDADDDDVEQADESEEVNDDDRCSRDNCVLNLTDLEYYTNSLMNLEHKIPSQCRKNKRKSGSTCSASKLRDFHITSITSKGLEATVNLQCLTCFGFLHKRAVREDIKPSLNKRAVLGTTLTGQGLYAHQTLMSTMNVRPIQKKMYYSLEKELQIETEAVLTEVLDNAVAEEKRLTETHENGYSFGEASSDGAWFTKPSKDGGYKSLGGYATIIGNKTYYFILSPKVQQFHWFSGHKTGKVIAANVKQLYCKVCSNHKGDKSSIPVHQNCTKNFDKPPGQMEPAIVAEELKKLAAKKLVIKLLVQDGDASTMKEIDRTQPYRGLPISIQRPIKCRCFLHACRCCIRSIRHLRDTNANTKRLLSPVVDRVIKDLRCVIKKYHDQWEGADETDRLTLVDRMANELQNIGNHCLEDHSNCGDWCTKQGENDDKIQLDDWIAEKFQRPFDTISSEANSLILRRSTNANENVNAGEFFYLPKF